jgi:two-component system chemotaxis response regulator CheY
MERRDARLLVVDDLPTSSVATHHALRALGCRLIDEAGDPGRAVRFLAERDYDLIISNWEMPSMSGAELLKLIRQTPRLERVPVVIATLVTPAVVAEAARAGVSAFLPRPIARQQLEEVLRIFVGGRRPELAAHPPQSFRQ